MIFSRAIYHLPANVETKENTLDEIRYQICLRDPNDNICGSL